MYDAGPAAEITRTELRQRRTVLEDIDTANMLVFATRYFWLLGVGIVCGAIWADVELGLAVGVGPRKETFFCAGDGDCVFDDCACAVCDAAGPGDGDGGAVDRGVCDHAV